VAASIREQALGGLRWITAAGPRVDAFRALGAYTRADIRAVLGNLPERGALHDLVRDGAGRPAFEALRAVTLASHAAEYDELAALADGAGLDLDEVLLANFRGDLGGEDGVGCSDLGWRRDRSYLAHNEDGAPALRGRVLLLTLLLDDEPPVTVQWYPGFLPSNTFVITGHGLLWGINHIQVPRPAPAPGRYFVARALQRAPSLDSALDYLYTHPSAGGLAYTLADLTSRRVVTVESAAGQVAVTEADPDSRPLLWHTNHLRHLHVDHPSAEPCLRRPTTEPDGGTATRAVRALGHLEESLARGRVLDALAPPQAEPPTSWFLNLLTRPAPAGVYRSATDGDPLQTLCTTVVDITAGLITVKPCGHPAVALPVHRLVERALPPQPQQAKTPQTPRFPREKADQ
jgi:hypothetical protein